jgi:hypothetical protein
MRTGKRGYQSKGQLFAREALTRVMYLAPTVSCVPSRDKPRIFTWCLFVHLGALHFPNGE